jgi:hypothetical protein
VAALPGRYRSRFAQFRSHPLQSLERDSLMIV